MTREGRDRKSFVCLEKLDDILGHWPATEPAHFIDISAEIAESQEETVPLVAASDEEDSYNTLREDEQDKQSDDTKQAEDDNTRGKQTKTDRKRKRPAKEGMTEKAIVVIGKIVKL